MRVSAILLSALVLPFLAPSAVADLNVSIRFSSKETSVIHEFFRDYYVDKKGGKKERKPLPPGIAKNLARDKPLPPGIAKRALPNDLLIKLPPWQA